MQKPERAFYRIVYPPMFRPKIEIKGADYDVLNLSEKGLKFELPSRKKDEQRPQFDHFIKGVVRFVDGEVVLVEGKILRREDSAVILLLTVGIPLSKIMSEQLYLIQKFRDLSQ